MLTVRSGSLSRVTVTSTVPPSATLYADCSKLTVTCGSSSSAMATVVSSGAPGAHPRSASVPKASFTLSPSSSTSSAVALKVMLFSVSPLLKLTVAGTPE